MYHWEKKKLRKEKYRAIDATAMLDHTISPDPETLLATSLPGYLDYSPALKYAERCS